MSAKSFFKSVPPKLVHSFHVTKGRTVEIWTTTCIATNFRKEQCSDHILVNPSNPQLSGVSNFPYFPRGGPVPSKQPVTMHKDWQPLGFVSSWGGMEVGNGMLYPVSVVDGLVHLHGGWRLRLECTWHRLKAKVLGREACCPVGTAVMTSAGNDRLATSYEAVIHTTPPFYQHDANPLDTLRRCYYSALDVAYSSRTVKEGKALRLAFPLLGSGARGFPKEIAMQVASTSCVKWCNSSASTRSSHIHHQHSNDCHLTLVFGLLEEKHAEQMAGFVETAIKRHTP
jgi:O-acetyl-ADP-ribose deacetylase (regulator of RNase III)